MSTSAPGIYRLPVTIRKLTEVDRSGHWLGQGWRDFRAAPVVSFTYGAAFVLFGLAITVGAHALDLGSVVLPLAGGFAIVAPILVVGLYDVSRRLEAGLPAALSDCFGAFGRSAGQLAAMGVILLIAYLVWVRVALLLFAIFFSDQPPALDRFVQDVAFSADGAALLLLGTAIGAGFAATVFAITAVSVPLIYDRPIDAATAVGVSLLTVRENFRVMVGWAALIAVSVAAGVVTVVGLAVVMPILAFATWHAYRDLIGDGITYADDALARPLPQATVDPADTPS